MSRTYLALLHYDGRDFAGWQRQPEARTVQAEFERVLERLCGRRVLAHGAGRTDAGVHALGMGVSFAVPEKWTAEQLHRALNALLPRDCWVERLSAMTSGFHARKSATGRRYRYVIGTDEAAASPFRRPYEWALGRPLEQTLLESAAANLLGRHSFRAFAVRNAVDDRANELGNQPRLVPGGPPREPLGPYDCTIRQARVGAPGWCPGLQLSGRGRPVPASHGSLPRGYHGGHRSWTPPPR